MVHPLWAGEFGLSIVDSTYLQYVIVDMKELFNATINTNKYQLLYSIKFLLI